MIEYAAARRSPPGRRDRRRAARSGGRPRAAALRARGRRRARRPAPDERPDRPRTAARSCARSIEQLGIGVFTGTRTTAIMGTGQGPRRAAARTTDDLQCDMVVVAAGIRPNIDLAVTSGFTVERAIVVDDQMRTVEDDDVYAVGECVQHRGEVYGLVAPLWEQAVVLADQITGADPDARSTSAPGPRPSSRSPASRSPSMGITEPERDTDEHIVFSEPKRGRLQVRGHPRREAHRRDPARRQQEGRLPAAGLRPRAAAARGAGRAAVRPRRSRRPRSASPSWPTTPRSATATASQGRRSCDAVEGGCKTVTAVMDKTRAGKGCGSCKRLVGQIVEWAAGGAVEEDPSVH